jgi:IS1 family transposase
VKRYYERLEVDEFWTYVGNKGKKYWLIYAYEREGGEIVAYVWGKRDLRTAKRLKKKILKLDIAFGCICTDDWQNFITTFKENNHVVGKAYTVGIEGNNCRVRHRIRRAFRKTCCFSKKLFNHWKAFELAFFYINYGYV